MNDAAWKDLFRVQWDKLSQIDTEDHMSAGYRDILTGPRLCVSEKFYPASWWSSFFSPRASCSVPLYRDGGFMRRDDISAATSWWFVLNMRKHGTKAFAKCEWDCVKGSDCWTEINWKLQQKPLKKDILRQSCSHGLNIRKDQSGKWASYYFQINKTML